jgi:SPP1 family predicted phage head-tail adaptor
MRFSDITFLIGDEANAILTKNEQGDIISAPIERMVFANKKSIRQSEFYQAQATGLKPELTFEIHVTEYADEESLVYKEKTYNIIRTFEKGEKLELICEGTVITNATA